MIIAVIAMFSFSLGFILAWAIASIKIREKIREYEGYLRNRRELIASLKRRQQF